MAPQVIALLAEQWQRPLDGEKQLFHQFFDHPLQRARGVRLVALDGQSVCGFQSYAYWPYQWEGETLHTLQSGGSVVSPDYRGKGIFARLLSFPWHINRRPAVSFLTGFPIGASYGSLLRNQWANPLNLSWYVRVLHPFSVLRTAKPRPIPHPFETAPVGTDWSQAPGVFSLSRDPAFVEWRASYAPRPYWYFHFQEGGRTIRYQLKPNRRGRVSELIIGDVARESPDPGLLTTSLEALVRAAKQDPSFTILSIAINDRCADASLQRSLAACGFRPIRRRIFFAVKALSGEAPVMEAKNWFLLRSDIDTW